MNNKTKKNEVGLPPLKGDEIVIPIPATKPRLSGNMFPNINTCENGWSNFSGNLRVVATKLLELTQFTTPNISIYFQAAHERKIYNFANPLKLFLRGVHFEYHPK